ncbi:hypothetical protein OJ997_07420 [Solirubrobacter phytolaccae]|uniref:Uncharacterized protein n=1 Tax=Solirubrobacter phytolaccae TaxID=1404360 RepID=A0A9X3N5P6_9ACTN|nr:hypothetical protein [Solirubrobacter phytolaccae]MDA0180119.1 hypothetical protein [Solirubrobacter phytolaccae]
MGTKPVCRHLVGLTSSVDGPSYYEWFTGVGLQRERLCAECVAHREGGGTIALVAVGEAELEDADLVGIRGAPEVRERAEPFDDRVELTRLPWEILDFAPADDAWLFVLRDGTIHRDLEPVCRVELPPAEPAHAFWGGAARLHVSPDGAFAAVTNDHGHHGAVCDLATGRRTLTLDGGDYHPETVPLSFAFGEHEGRTVAVHRTAWNRLALSDASTGEALVAHERELDYFHGRLLVSPDGRRLLDDGWVWHPYGIPTVWPLTLDAHVRLTDRAYYWNHGLCWLDDDRIAIGGIGTHDDWMLDGARLFAAGGEELTAFAGPSGHFFGDGDRLFAAGDDGLTLWDVAAGAMVGRIDGFRPTRQNRAGRELAEVSGGVLRRWRY